MDFSSTKITFIGGGNMARSLISGLIENGLSPKNIQVVEPNLACATTLRQDFLIHTQAKANAEILNVDFVFFAVKPQILKIVCTELASLWNGSSANILSIAAGIKTQSIGSWLEQKESSTSKIIRAMPNTPALIGLGATGLFCSDQLNDYEKSSIENIFNAVGTSVWVNTEDDLDTVTALSGSGPAYFFSLCEHLIKAGIELGLEPDQAHQLVVQTAVGAAQMAKLTPINGISALRNNVTSKGGTTEAGIKALNEQNFERIIKNALQVAKNRSQEMSKEFI